MKVRFSTTLQTALISVVSIAVSLIILIATLLHLSIVSHSLNNQLKDKALVLAQTFDISTQNGQDMEDVKKLQQKILALKASRPDINEIEITVPVSEASNRFYIAATTSSTERGSDPDNSIHHQVIQTDVPRIILEVVDRRTGKDLRYSSQEEIGLREVAKSFFHKDQLYVWEIISPLHNDQNQVVGSIGIEISLDEVIAQIQASLLKSVLIFLGSLAGIILIIWYCVRRIIIHPLRVLADGIQTVQEGDFSYKLEVKRPDELGHLAAAYNDMVASLHRSRSEITELNRSLQSRVDEATAELQEMNRALALKVEELEKTQQRLIRSERDAAAAMIAAGIAHEIKNPLSAIKLVVQHIQDKFVDAEVRKDPKYQDLYQIFLNQIQQLDGLVMAFLDYTRPVRLHPISCSLHEILESALALVINDGAPWPGISVQRDYAENLPPVKVDREMIKRAFVNLLLNAVQAMPDGGVLTIRTEFISETHQVQVTLADTGIGIEEAHLEKLFDPFFTTKANGIGLGLAVVQRALLAHGGQISVTSQVGKGTSFCIELSLEP